MLRAIARRLALSLLVVWLVTVLVLVSTEVLPGDALQVSLTADEAAQMSGEDLARRRAELGLDRPAVVRYGDWLFGALRGDFGRTIIGKAEVAEVICIFEETELNVLAFFEEMHSKRELVTAFIAVLEIVRTESVKLVQKKTFGEIILKAVTNGTGN